MRLKALYFALQLFDNDFFVSFFKNMRPGKVGEKAGEEESTNQAEPENEFVNQYRGLEDNKKNSSE